MKAATLAILMLIGTAVLGTETRAGEPCDSDGSSHEAREARDQEGDRSPSERSPGRRRSVSDELDGRPASATL